MKSLARIVVTVLRKYPGQSVLMVFLMAVAGLLEGASITLIIPLLSKLTGEREDIGYLEQLTRDVLEVLHVPNELTSLLFLLVFVITVSAVFKFASGFQIALITARFARNMRSDLTSAILRSSWGYSSQLSPGMVNSALGIEVESAASVFPLTGKLIALSWQAIVGFTVAAMISTQITVGGIVFGILLAALFSTFIRRTRTAAINRRDAMNEMLARIVDAMSSLKAIKSMGDEQRFIGLLGAKIEIVRDARARLDIYERAVNILPEPAAAAAMAIGLYFYIVVYSGSLEPAMALAILFSRSTTAIRLLQRAYQSMVRQEPSYRFLTELLKDTEKAAETIGGKPASKVWRSINLDDLTIVYPGQVVAALRNISLQFQSSGLVVVTGPSGSGKSTLINAIAGIEVPTSGKIMVDGTDMSDLDMTSWRCMVGYVPQEIVLFPESIRENVSLGNDKVASDDIVEVLRMVDAWRFVDKLPGGMETQVGQSGSKLSGGERQRISLARALLRKPRILILDEPTAALDSATENEICTTLRRISETILVIVITHRPAIVNFADTVIQLEDGSVHKMSKNRDTVGMAALDSV